MKELFAVYLESLDQDLKVYNDRAEAEKRLEELTASGKPAKMEVFGSHQIVAVDKANGCAANDPHFWEEQKYDNGRYTLTESFSWHTEPDEEGYYADYLLS